MVNWASYNESLIRRGEVILDFDIIDGWYGELERMNEGKIGAAYGYPVLRQQTNPKRWKRSMGYGKRWIAETVFSCIKRMFGEYVNARKYHNMTKELVIKASLYNMFVAMKM